MPRTAVIGAGPAGCTAAHILHEAGRDVVLFDKAPHVGGRTYTYREHGLEFDTGAGFFTNFYPRVHAYNAQFGLNDQVVELVRAQMMVHEGREEEFAIGSLGSFLRYGFLTLPDKLRVLWYTARQTLRRSRLDLVDPRTLAPLDTASIADEARAAMGERAYNFLIRSGVEPFWYFSCEEVSRALLIVLQANAADAKFYTYTGGMDTLAQALSAPVERVLGHEAQSITADTAGEVRVHFRTEEGEESTQTFDEVVVATTATVAHRLVRDVDLPSVTPFQREFLASQRYVPTVHAFFLIDRADAPPGVPTYLPTGPGTHPLAALDFARGKWADPARLPEGREGVHIFLTPETARELRDADDATLAAEAWRRARLVCPRLPKSAEFRVAFRHHEAIPVHAVGRYAQAVRFQDAQRPPVVFAGDYLATATIEGAIRSGHWAADHLLGR